MFSFLKNNKTLLLLLLFSIIITLVKLVFISSPAMPRTDDAYYYRWSQSLMLSYPDHPPMIGYLVGFSVWLFGRNALAIEMLGYLLYIALAILSYLTIKHSPLFAQQHRTTVGLLTVISLTLCPYFAGISVIMSPDTPLMFFGILALLSYGYCFFTPHAKLWQWLLSGALMALAFGSKLTFFFPGISIVFYALLSRNRRNYLQNPYFYISFVPTLIVAALLLYGDYLHDFMMLRYSAMRAERPFFIYDFIGFWFSQISLHTPYYAILFYVLTIKTAVLYFQKNDSFVSKANTRNLNFHNSHIEKMFFFAVLSLPSLIYILGKSFTSFLGSYWSSFAYLGAFFLTVNYLAENWHRMRIRLFTAVNFTIAFLYLSFVPLHTMFGVADPNYTGPIQKSQPTQINLTNVEISEPVKEELTSRLVDNTSSDFWAIEEDGFFDKYNHSLARFARWSLKKFGEYPVDNTDAYHSYSILKNSLKRFHSEKLDSSYPILTDSYGLASLIDFLLPEVATVNQLTPFNSSLQLSSLIKKREKNLQKYTLFDIVFHEDEVVGKNVYLILQFTDQIAQRRSEKSEFNQLLYKPALDKACAKWQLLKALYSYRFQKQVGQFFIFECKNYRKSIP